MPFGLQPRLKATHPKARRARRITRISIPGNTQRGTRPVCVLSPATAAVDMREKLQACCIIEMPALLPAGRFRAGRGELPRARGEWRVASGDARRGRASEGRIRPAAREPRAQRDLRRHRPCRRVSPRVRAGRGRNRIRSTSCVSSCAVSGPRSGGPSRFPVIEG